MITKNEKLKTLAFMYIIPLIAMVIFPLVKNIEVNGEPASWFILAVFGFACGIGVEGALFILGLTIAVLTDKM